MAAVKELNDSFVNDAWSGGALVSDLHTTPSIR